jgi:D-3-phosphoglycerate dehydrogenase
MQVELPKHQERIRDLGYEVVAPDLGGRQQFSASELLEFKESLVGVIAGDDELSSRFFTESRQLKTVIRWGIGMDSVDLEAARLHGVIVRNTPGVFGSEVADSAFGYILNLARGYIAIDAAVRSGGWPKVEGLTLSGTRLGIVGFGAVGREIAKRGLGFGMEIVAHDPFVSGAPAGAQMVAIEALLATSRFVVLACPLTQETLHLIDAERLALMRSDAFLINVARGPVVLERDLVAALKGSQLAGAALDVFEKEPLPIESELRQLPNVVLGSHNASNTREGVARASQVAVDFLIEELSR